MRLLIELNSDKNEVILPIHYNHQVQAAIYESLDTDFATFLHDTGYKGEGRNFKLFTFSRLIGKFSINKPKIMFEKPLKLIVSSPVDKFCQSLLNGLLTRNSFKLGNEELLVESVKAELPKVDQEEIRIKMLSPVVAYTTLFRADGAKYTCYHQPGEKDFSRIIGENLRKKHMALYKQAPPEGDVEVMPIRPPRLHVIEYKNFIIKGYSGLLILRGPNPLLQVALDAGLGSKNSMGFGCLEIT